MAHVNFHPAVAFTLAHKTPQLAGVPPPPSTRLEMINPLVGSWDNDDYLEGLSGKASKKAENHPSPEEPDPYAGKSPSNKQEGSGMFARLIQAKEEAEAKGLKPGLEPHPPTYPPPPPDVSFQQPPPPGYYPPPPNYPYYPPPGQAQFQQPYAPQAQYQQPPQGQAQYYPPPPPGGYPGYPYPPPPIDPNLPPGTPPLPPPEVLLGGGRASMPERPTVNPGTGQKMRPPDIIANTADLYLETLKLDTATRTRAFQRGDYETANKVFADPRINELKQKLMPYLESEARKQQQQDVSTVEEEMLPYVESEKRRWRDGENTISDDAKSYTGVSYKEKMLAKKKGLDVEEKARPLSSESATVAPVEPAPVLPVVVPVLPVVAPVEPSPLPVDIQSPQVTSQTTNEQTDDLRSTLRTFMGLLLKHRGGAGFGAGRLKNPAEIQKFIDTADIILNALGKETGATFAKSAAEKPLVTYSPPPTSTADKLEAGGVTDDVIVELMGYMLQIRSSTLTQPADIEKFQGLLQKVSKALGTTIFQTSTVDKTASVRMDMPLSAELQNVNSSIKAFSNNFQSPFALTSLRDALAEAVTACNKRLGQDSVSAVASSPTVQPTPVTVATQPALSTPVSVATQPVSIAAPPVAEPVTSEPSISDKVKKEIADRQAKEQSTSPEDLELLEQVYDKLQNIAGNASLGLKSGLSGEDADEAATMLSNMRRVLMEELESSTSSAQSSSSSSGSKYQQLLNKKLAEKAARTAGDDQPF